MKRPLPFVGLALLVLALAAFQCPGITIQFGQPSTTELTPTPVSIEEASAELDEFIAENELVLEGAAGISVANLTDANLEITATEAGSEAEGQEGEPFAIEPFQIYSLGILPPGGYQLEFTYPEAAYVGGTCTIEVVEGDFYQFAAIPEGVLIARKGYTPQSAADLVVSTSALCQD